MKREVCVVDTNVVVSGLIGSSTGAPARMLSAMLDGGILYLMSADLLAEYSCVLDRPNIARRHGRTRQEIRQLLAELVANAMWRNPVDRTDAPNAGDNHLWALLASPADALLVTGDRLLVANPPSGTSVTSPRHFVDTFLPYGGG